MEWAFKKPYGLVALDGCSTPLQLTDVQVTCSVANLTSNVTVIFSYKNHLLKPVQGSFIFPLGDIAFYGFEAEVEGRKIIAKCRPRAEAKTTFEEAVKAGNSAFLAEQDEHCEDVFQMTIGNIPQNGKVMINLKYVGHLACEMDGSGNKSQAIFTLPSVINPRYSPSGTTIKSEFEPFSRSVAVNSSAYRISFEATLVMPQDILSVSSERDAYSVIFGDGDRKSAKVKMTSPFQPDHDLQMVVKMADRLLSSAIIESGDQLQTGILSMDCLMAQFLPDFSGCEGLQEQRNEVYFVVDRSGSMGGPRIKYASSSLLLLLKSLPVGCRFQIIGFGSTYSCLFREPTEYNETSLKRAIQYQVEMEADMGGTEVLQALRAAFDTPLSGQGWYKQIIFLTDGDVSNADEVIGLVSSNVEKGRVFAIGIGTGCSTALVSGVARAGRGMAAFIRDNTQMHAVVMRILKAALQPRASEVVVNWSVMKNDPPGSLIPVNVVSVPAKIPPVFLGDFVTVYGLLPTGNCSNLSGELTLEYEILGRKHSQKIDMASVKFQDSEPDQADMPLHRLAGKCQINELGDRYKAELMANPEVSKADGMKNLRNQIEQLSCAVNVLSIFTGLVGVDPVKQEVQPQAPALPQPPSQHPGFGARFRRRSGERSMFLRKKKRACRKTGAYDAVDGLSFERGFDRIIPQSSEMMSVDDDSADGAVDESNGSTVLLKIAELQNIFGFWNLDRQLSECLNLSLDVLKKAKPETWTSSSKHTITDQVWATVLVLDYLASRLTALSDVWELLAKKARNWLITQASALGNSPPVAERLVDALLEQAKSVVRSA